MNESKIYNPYYKGLKDPTVKYGLKIENIDYIKERSTTLVLEIKSKNKNSIKLNYSCGKGLHNFCEQLFKIYKFLGKDYIDLNYYNDSVSWLDNFIFYKFVDVVDYKVYDSYDLTFGDIIDKQSVLSSSDVNDIWDIMADLSRVDELSGDNHFEEVSKQIKDNIFRAYKITDEKGIINKAFL